MTLQEAFNMLYKLSSDVLDADIELGEQERNDAMNNLWKALRKAYPLYSGKALDKSWLGNVLTQSQDE